MGSYSFSTLYKVRQIFVANLIQRTFILVIKLLHSNLIPLLDIAQTRDVIYPLFICTVYSFCSAQRKGRSLRYPGVLHGDPF